MKNIFKIMALALVATVAMYTPNVQAQSRMKTLTMASTVTLNTYFASQSCYYLEANDSFTLTLVKIKNGGDIDLIVKKTVSVPVLITTSATVIGETSPIALNGASGSFYTFHITNNGTVDLIQQTKTAPLPTFSTITMSNDTATINALNVESGNYYISYGDTFKLKLQNLRDGAKYRVLIKKTFSGVMVVTPITTSTLTNGSTSISFTGSTNTYWYLTIFVYQGTIFIHKE